MKPFSTVHGSVDHHQAVELLVRIEPGVDRLQVLGERGLERRAAFGASLARLAAHRR